MTRRSSHSGGRRPKSAKARSRGKCGSQEGSKRYEDWMSAAPSMEGMTRARGDVNACMQGKRVECDGHLGGHAECINERLAEQWTAWGRNAERFHNFRVLA